MAPARRREFRTSQDISNMPYIQSGSLRVVADGSIGDVPLSESAESSKMFASHIKQSPVHARTYQQDKPLSTSQSGSSVPAPMQSTLSCEIKYITFIDKEIVHTWLVDYEGTDCYFSDFLDKSNAAIGDFVHKSNPSIIVETNSHFCLELEAADMDENRDNRMYLEGRQFDKIDHWIRQILGGAGEDLYVQIIRECKSRPSSMPRRATDGSDSYNSLSESQGRSRKRARLEHQPRISPSGDKVSDAEQPCQPEQSTSQSTWTVLYKPRETPLITGGSDLEHLRHYLNWLESVGYIKRTIKEAAQKGLDDLGFGFELLRHVRQDEWEKMGVPRGAAMQILGKDKAWVEKTRRPSN